nr:MAG TPA: hypothetical protein [Bacteriophage sp.]
MCRSPRYGAFCKIQNVKRVICIVYSKTLK